jgi:hypothetical protein
VCLWEFLHLPKKKEIRKFASRFFSSIDPVCVCETNEQKHTDTRKKQEKTFSNNKSFLLICASRKVFFFF